MPFYEYRCEACGHEMELLQKITDEPLRECPSCSKAQLRKLVSAAGFRLKGGGWYETDFKSANKRNLLTSSEGSKDSEGSGKTRDKQENAPAAKSKPEKSSASAAATG